MLFSSDGESLDFLNDDENNEYIGTGPNDPTFGYFLSDINVNVEQIEHNKTKGSKKISKQKHGKLQTNSFLGNRSSLSGAEKNYFSKKNEVIKFISDEVLVGQHKKFTRKDKIIVFEIIQKYILMLYPNNANIGIIKELTRNEKRKTEFLERRFQYHSSIIYSIFQTPFKKEMCLKILQRINQMAILKLEKEILMINDEKLIAKKREFITGYKAELDEISKQIGL